MDKFTWDIQLAGNDFDEYDKRGETTYDNFVSEFDRFPWIEQLEKRNAMTEGSSATLSVKDVKTSCDFWISISGNKSVYIYLIGYIYPKTVKGFFGLGKPKTKRWCEIYLTNNVPDIKYYLKLFFDRDRDSLESSIRKLDKFDEMEAQN